MTAEPSVVLVEGTSDQLAVEALAARLGRDLAAEGVVVQPMGGATNIGHHLGRLDARVARSRVYGLCDAGEVGAFLRALERAGAGTDLREADLDELGFFVCVADLEDELIRAVGPEGVEQLIADVGEHRSWRTFQSQPAQRGRPLDAQLRRFIGTRSGRKARYAPLLVQALDLARVPAPLARLVARTAEDTAVAEGAERQR